MKLKKFAAFLFAFILTSLCFISLPLNARASDHYMYYLYPAENEDESNVIFLEGSVKVSELRFIIEEGLEFDIDWETDSYIVDLDNKELSRNDLVPNASYVVACDAEFSYDFIIIVSGDVNRDGVVTATDARMVLRYSAGLESFDDFQLSASYANEDDEITAADARTVLRVSAGLDVFYWQTEEAWEE